MTSGEAILKANGFVLEVRGVRADPDFIRLIEKPGENAYWLVCYGAKHFFPDEVAAGSVIDGGEYFVRVDSRVGTRVCGATRSRP